MGKPVAEGGAFIVPNFEKAVPLFRTLKISLSRYARSHFIQYLDVQQKALKKYFPLFPLGHYLLTQEKGHLIINNKIFS